MTSSNGSRLYGTRPLHNEPIIDRVVDAVPPAYTIPLVDSPLEIDVTGYNVLHNKGYWYALGRLGTRMFNTFLIADPSRSGTITTVDIRNLWQAYGVDVDMSRSGPVLRGISALNQVRKEIDGKPFIEGGFAGPGHLGHLALAEDLVFTDMRPIDEITTWQ